LPVGLIFLAMIDGSFHWGCLPEDRGAAYPYLPGGVSGSLIRRSTRVAVPIAVAYVFKRHAREAHDVSGAGRFRVGNLGLRREFVGSEFDQVGDYLG
jgi:hypothetical protein